MFTFSIFASIYWRTWFQHVRGRIYLYSCMAKALSEMHGEEHTQGAKPKGYALAK
jgi:hypothetical protein